MRSQEQKLLNDIVSLNTISKTMDSMALIDIDYNTFFQEMINKKEHVEQAFETLQSEKLGAVSSDFIGHSEVIHFINQQDNKSLTLWHFIQSNSLAAIEDKIKQLTDKYHEELRTGRGIPPDELYSFRLIRSIYLSENPALIDIFKRYLPIPGVDVFKGYDIPTVVADNNVVIEQSIQALRERTPSLSLDKITNNVIKIQRQMRSKLRYQEEIRRIAFREEWAYINEKITPQKAIQDADTPYCPKCTDKLLAERIMVAARHVRLFSTVKHWTSSEHIGSIFDDSLYGRRRLLESYLPFRPASLYECDIADGDGNVICFGPSKIDPKAMKPDTVEILFNLDKISKNNPSIFFKQRDLGFSLDKKRSVPIKDKSCSFLFSHTNSVQNERPGFVYFSAYDVTRRGQQCQVALPNYSLISYNVKEIHQILTLNFFRFLDAGRGKDFKLIRNRVYTYLSEISDEKLVKFLKNVGRKLSDTSEFNFYGAHRIDFSTVIALSFYQYEDKVSYTLNLKDLIASLGQNDIRMLNEAKAHLPRAFNSYRFLDYLLANTTSILGRYELQRLRANCITPSWIQPVSEPEPVAAGESTMQSTWCGYFKPVDANRVDEEMLDLKFSAEPLPKK